MNHLACDYLILGSGAAGSVLSYKLSRNNKVFICDIASLSIKGAYRHKAKYINKQSLDYSHVDSGVFGGKTQLWANKIYLIDKNDCRNWPIKYLELLQYSKKLAKIFSIDHQLLIRKKKYFSKYHLRSSLRQPLGNIFNYFKLSHNKNIKTIEKSTAVKFHFTGDKITQVNIENFGGEKTSIKISKAVIFAAGGLGNLPLFERVIRDKGKIPIKSFRLEDQPHYKVRLSSVKDPIKETLKKVPKNSGKQESSLAFSCFDRNYQLQMSESKYADILFRRFESRIKQNQIAKFLKFFLRCTTKLLTKIEHCFNVFSSIFSNNKKNISLEIWGEHCNKDISGVFVSDENWFNNKLRKIDVKYKISRKSTNGLIRYLDHYLEPLGIKPIGKSLSGLFVYTGLKPSSSTPMMKKGSEVDINQNLRINCIENCFMIGTNVFPNSGVTNPTWTLMCMALRLYEYLEEN